MNADHSSLITSSMGGVLRQASPAVQASPPRSSQRARPSNRAVVPIGETVVEANRRGGSASPHHAASCAAPVVMVAHPESPLRPPGGTFSPEPTFRPPPAAAATERTGQPLPESFWRLSDFVVGINTQYYQDPNKQGNQRDCEVPASTRKLFPAEMSSTTACEDSSRFHKAEYKSAYQGPTGDARVCTRTGVVQPDPRKNRHHETNSSLLNGAPRRPYRQSRKIGAARGSVRDRTWHLVGITSRHIVRR